MSDRLALRHVLLATLVVAVWGTNFVVIKTGLRALPPLTFAALRFVFVVFPAVFWCRRPAVRWRELAAYGCLIGGGQFGLLYVAMQRRITPGLASLVLQMQVFFTVAIAVFCSRERIARFQWLGLGLASLGLAVVALSDDGSCTPAGLCMVLLASLAWALGNTIVRRAGEVSMVAFIVWSSVFAVPPLLALSITFDGIDRMEAGLRAADASTWLAVSWQSVGNSLFGYAAWSWLLSKYPAGTVAPMALLVPVFGMAASRLWLHEALPVWKLGAAALVLAGLAVNVIGASTRRASDTPSRVAASQQTRVSKVIAG